MYRLVRYMRMIPDALSLEYKREYGCARRQLELSDIVNYPPLASEFRRLGLRFPEETLNLLRAEVRPFGDHSPDAALITLNPV